MRIKIEKNIPLPTRIPTSKKRKASGIADILKEMKIGDSFLYPETRRNSIYTSAKQVGIKIVVAKIRTSTVRVWRIE